MVSAPILRSIGEKTYGYFHGWIIDWSLHDQWTEAVYQPRKPIERNYGDIHQLRSEC